MKAIAIQLRALQLFAHNAHNLAKGDTFFADHEFLGELYAAYEGEYDSVVERMIGLSGTADLAGINRAACEMATKISADTPSLNFTAIQAFEAALRSQIEIVMPKATAGTQNLIAGIADNSEVRSYKISRRIK